MPHTGSIRMSFRDDYRKMVSKKNELDMLRSGIVNEIEEYFAKSNLKMNDIRLYSEYIFIQTGYEVMTLDELCSIADKFKDLDVRIQNSNGLLAITIRI